MTDQRHYEELIAARQAHAEALEQARTWKERADALAIQCRNANQAREAVEAALATQVADAKAAAGELGVSVDDAPPGSVAGKLLTANVILRRRCDDLRLEREGARQNVGRYREGWARDSARLLGLLREAREPGPSWSAENWRNWSDRVDAVLSDAPPPPRDVDEVIAYLKGRTERAAAVFAEGLEAVETLIDSSEAVAGLHGNGELAPWDSLRTGGEFGTWLEPFDRALAELRKPADEERGGPPPKPIPRYKVLEGPPVITEAAIRSSDGISPFAVAEAEGVPLEEIGIEAPDDGSETTIGRMVRTAETVERVGREAVAAERDRLQVTLEGYIRRNAKQAEEIERLRSEVPSEFVEAERLAGYLERIGDAIADWQADQAELAAAVAPPVFNITLPTTDPLGPFAVIVARNHAEAAITGIETLAEAVETARAQSEIGESYPKKILAGDGTVAVNLEDPDVRAEVLRPDDEGD